MCAGSRRAKVKCGALRSCPAQTCSRDRKRQAHCIISLTDCQLYTDSRHQPQNALSAREITPMYISVIGMPLNAAGTVFEFSLCSAAPSR